MAGFDINVFRENLNDWISKTFKLGPSNTIGIDIGTSSVKVAEVLNPKNGVFKINKFAYQALPEGSIIEDDIVKPEEVVSAIKECFDRLSIKNVNVTIGLFGPNTMSKRIQVSTGSKKDVEDQVMWESEQYIPFGIDDSTVSFHVIGENEGGGTDVYVAAAANKLIQSYQKILLECQLKLKIIDLNCFAFANSFEFSYSELISNTLDSILLLDFGAQTTYMVIYKNKNIIFTRELSVGGHSATEEIQRQMNLSYVEAENLKCNGDENGNVAEEIIEAVNLASENIIAEIKKTINFYLTSTTDVNITRCFITGGNSLLYGLKNNLEKNLGLNVEKIDLTTNFEFNSSNIDDDLLKYINSSGAVAIGLGMRKLFK